MAKRADEKPLRPRHLGSVPRALLKQIAPQPFAARVYRCIGSRFLHAPLSSAGALRYGGRFNPPGRFEVLYTALAADTALAEREGILLTDSAIKLAHGIRTTVLLRIECRLARVLDLTDQAVRERLGLSLGDLLGPWLPWNIPPSAGAPQVEGLAAPTWVAVTMSPGQRLGVAVYASRRFEAILAPSAKDPSGRCLAIFPDRLQPQSVVLVDDPGGTLRGVLGLRD